MVSKLPSHSTGLNTSIQDLSQAPKLGEQEKVKATSDAATAAEQLIVAPAIPTASNVMFYLINVKQNIGLC